jgi:hypothetical protein
MLENEWVYYCDEQHERFFSEIKFIQAFGKIFSQVNKSEARSGQSTQSDRNPVEEILTDPSVDFQCRNLLYFITKFWI